MKPVQQCSIRSKRVRDDSQRSLVDSEAIKKNMDGKHRYRGLTIDEVQRMTAQGLRISDRDPRYMICSVCTKSGLMLDFLSLDKIKSHYNEGGFHDILARCRISRLSGSIDDGCAVSGEMADIDNFHIKKTDPESIEQHLSFVGRCGEVPTHVKTLKKNSMMRSSRNCGVM